MFRLIIVATLIHISSTIALSEDPYDDEPVLYMDTRSSKYRSQKPFHNRDERRSVMDNNFLRFGRNHGDSDSFLPLRDEIETEYDDFNNEFARPTRSQDKNDNFVRFGRGNSDFVRFGRDPYRYQREMRGGEQNFVRFGRSTLDEDLPKKRNKRDVHDDLKAKRAARDDFLRFGRGGDDSFVRYGRNPDVDKINNGDETMPTPTQSHPFVHGQSLRYPISVNERLLLHHSPLLSILRKLEEMRQSN